MWGPTGLRNCKHDRYYRGMWLFRAAPTPASEPHTQRGKNVQYERHDTKQGTPQLRNCWSQLGRRIWWDIPWDNYPTSNVHPTDAKEHRGDRYRKQPSKGKKEEEKSNDATMMERRREPAINHNTQQSTIPPVANLRYRSWRCLSQSKESSITRKKGNKTTTRNHDNNERIKMMKTMQWTNNHHTTPHNTTQHNN